MDPNNHNILLIIVAATIGTPFVICLFVTIFYVMGFGLLSIVLPFVDWLERKFHFRYEDDE